MMWHTHAAMGASAVWLLLPFLPASHASGITGEVAVGEVAVMSVYAATGALLPDLDAAHSKIKYLKVAGITPLVPLSLAIYRAFGHRGLLHSFLGWGLGTFALLPLSLWLGGLPVAALAMGYAIHLTGDACTKSGIPLFYPRRIKFHLLPRNWRITTGSPEEELVFVIFGCLTLVFLMKSVAVNQPLL